MLEEKIETLTKEVVLLRQAIEKNGTGTTASAKPAAAAAAGKAAPKAKPKAVEPTHDADETGAAMRAAAKIDKPAVKEYISEVGCADLAELLTKPELFDAAFEFAEGITDASSGDDDDDV